MSQRSKLLDQITLCSIVDLQKLFRSALVQISRESANSGSHEGLRREIDRIMCETIMLETDQANIRDKKLQQVNEMKFDDEDEDS
jgi:hypothetical protein